MPPIGEDQGNANEGMTILLPGEEPTSTQDTAAPAATASPSGEEDHLRAAFEAAGVTPPEPKAPAATATLDPDLIEKLKGLDPAALPPELQERFDKKFHAAFTQKTQTLADERRAFEQQRNEWFNRMEKLMERSLSGQPKAQPQANTEIEALRERIRSGDVEAIDTYVEKMAQAKIAPVQNQVALREAYESAEMNEPLVKQHAEAIGAMFKANPELVGLLGVENYRYAPQVFTAMAHSAELQRLQQHVSGEAQRVTEAVTKALAAYKEKVSGLPTTTTLAGTTTTVGAPKPAVPQTIDEARAKTRADLKAMGLV